MFPGACRYDPLALHEAEPAIDEKWVCQTWIRQGQPGDMATMEGRAAGAAKAAAAEVADRQY